MANKIKQLQDQFFENNKDLFVQILTEQTTKFRKENNYDQMLLEKDEFEQEIKDAGKTGQKVMKQKLSEKATEIQNLVSTGKFGCNSEAVAEISSLLLGEKITYKEKRQETEFEFYIEQAVCGAVLVYMKDKKDKIVIMDEDGDFFDHKNNPPQINGNLANFRIPTEYEIASFVDKIIAKNNHEGRNFILETLKGLE